MEIIKILSAYVFSQLFVWSFVFYSKWQFIDEDDGPGYNLSDKKWHSWGALMRASLICVLCINFIPGRIAEGHYAIIGVLTLINWDLGLNMATKKDNLFYVASHGLDGLLGQKKWILYAAGLVASIVYLLIF